MPNADLDAHWSHLAAAIHNSGWQAFVAVTGGGSRAISVLLETPGASRSIIGAVVPYAPTALAHFLGGAPEQFCSAATARTMAGAALRLARECVVDHDAQRLVGVACTASLATDRPKLGDHRIHVAAQTAQATTSLAVVLEKGRRDRAGEERVATELVLNSLAGNVGVATLGDVSAALGLGAEEQVALDRVEATPEIAELVRGTRRIVMTPPDAAPPAIVFPGAFNPPHTGHLRMAELAETRLGQPLAWELSAANVDKPPLDFIAIRDRRAALAAQDARRPVALTHAATFREKAALFPGATFVVGADTLTRIADPHYYHGDAHRRDEAIAAIAAHGCRFLAFGRHVDGAFQTLADLDLPAALRALCTEVPATDFREDVSSTQIRSEG